jgi:WD40 repeat protein
VIVWDATSGAKLATCSGHTGVVTHAEWSRDGTRVSSVATDGTARVWDVRGESCTVHAVMKGMSVQYTLNLAHAHFSPDGTRLVVVSSVDTIARLYDTDTGALVAELPHDAELWWGSYSNDGSRIITTSSDKTAKLWDGKTGRLIASLEGHTFWVTCGVFTPDSKLAVTAGEDGTAKVWSAETGKLLFSYDLHKDWLGEVTVSDDGQRMISVGGDRTAKVWDMSYETRSPEEIDRLVQARIPWTLDGSRLIPKKLL